MLTLLVAWRLSTSRRYGVLGHFMTGAATAGIGVGVCAMIVCLAAVNGFEHELRTRVFSLLPAATLTPEGPAFHDAAAVAAVLLRSQDISAAAAAVQGPGLLSHAGGLTAVTVLGAGLEELAEVVEVRRFLRGQPGDFASRPDAMIIGRSLLGRLGMQPGDRLELTAALPGSSTAPGSTRTRTFRITGVIDSGSIIERQLCLIHAPQARELFAIPAPNALLLRTTDPLTARDTVLAAARGLPESVYLSTLMDRQGKNYHDIQLVRQVVYLAMVLIMGVASFTIITRLIMAVEDKHRELAILRTMGASPRLLVGALTLAGLLLALPGIVLGLGAGLLLALNLTALGTAAEQILGVQLLNKNIYFIDFIPAKIMAGDVLLVLACALLMSLTASILPALGTLRLNIIKQLNG